jgi:hypothetical protein
MLGVDVVSCELHGDPNEVSSTGMIRIVYTPAKPVAAFYTHYEAGESTFEGTEIASCDLRTTLPEMVRDDLVALEDYDEDDVTPVSIVDID